MAEDRMSREEYLDFMSDNWDTYLATLNALPDADQQRFAESQGFPSLQALLAHISAWWRELLRVVPNQADGESPRFDDDDFDLSRQPALQAHANETLAQEEQDFENVRGEVAALIAELPEEAFSDPNIARWLDTVIVTHYNDHLPPGDPQIPAAKHEQVYRNDQP